MRSLVKIFFSTGVNAYMNQKLRKQNDIYVKYILFSYESNDLKASEFI